MGQIIQVRAVPMGEVAIFDTDRSLSGQDGHDYDSLDEARAGSTFPAALAARIFERLDQVRHVYVLSNEVVVRRASPWDDPALEEAVELIRSFFIHYEQNRDPSAWEEQEEPADSSQPTADSDS